MKRTGILVAAFLCGIIVTAITIQAAVQMRPPGYEPYTPSKLEWLVLDMQALFGTSMTSSTRYSMGFSQKDGDAIVIMVTYLPDVDRETMNLDIASAREVIKAKAEAKSWNWVKIEERIKSTKL